jgi:gamma-glutamylcyclotransferase (GGCT)/AIG2-like uncharacterized protein YtfP
MVVIWQYGSNMDENRLNSGDRLGGVAKFIGLAIKMGHKLAFTHTNKCGVGTADIAVSVPEDFVIGCLYDIPDDKISKLDKIEGVNSGAYERQAITVIKVDENLKKTSEVIAQTYVVVKPKTDGDYANHILKGIIQHRMGENYFNKVRETILENNPNIQSELISYS